MIAEAVLEDSISANVIGDEGNTLAVPTQHVDERNLEPEHGRSLSVKFSDCVLGTMSESETLVLIGPPLGVVSWLVAFAFPFVHDSHRK